jgi:hypothetical protein
MGTYNTPTRFLKFHQKKLCTQLEQKSIFRSRVAWALSRNFFSLSRVFFFSRDLFFLTKKKVSREEKNPLEQKKFISRGCPYKRSSKKTRFLLSSNNSYYHIYICQSIFFLVEQKIPQH